MRRLLLVVALVAATLALASGPAGAAATCTTTGFLRDSIDMTAAKINPPGVVSGNVDATGCNIGVYYGPGHTGTVAFANVFGANYFGVVNNGGHVNVVVSSVHDIGEVPQNGTQHGRAIQFASDGGLPSGLISRNIVAAYQKNGIDVRGASSATISNNVVLGAGPVDFIAQNGIVVVGGSHVSVTGNTVRGNSYTGANLASSAGILVEAVGVTVVGNTAVGNDMGVYSQGDPAASAVASKNTVWLNKISNDAVTNTSGNGVAGDGYQSGISDAGTSDHIVGNVVCGVGYTPVTTPPPHLSFIDATTATTPVVVGNRTGTNCRLLRNDDRFSFFFGHQRHGDDH